MTRDLKEKPAEISRKEQAAQERAERLKQALRENLKRRKGQTRARTEASDEQPSE